MDRSIYLSMAGADQALIALQVNNNNLANVSTTGFLGDLVQFKSQTLDNNLPSRTYDEISNIVPDFTLGPKQTTGRDMDVAVNGDGWIAVQSSSGKEGYTRAGNLEVSSTGLLTTASGLPVIGNQGPITIPPAAKVEIASNGNVSILPLGQLSSALTLVDRIKLVNPSRQQLAKGDDGLMYSKQGEAQADSAVTVQTGALEGSNVKAVDSLINIVEISRYYETQMQLMHTVADLANKSTALLQLPT